MDLFTIDRRNDRLPRYLFVVMEMSTSVFEFKKTTVDAIEKPIFTSQESTVLVGELKNGEIIVQVKNLFQVQTLFRLHH